MGIFLRDIQFAFRLCVIDSKVDFHIQTILVDFIKLLSEAVLKVNKTKFDRRWHKAYVQFSFQSLTV